MKKKINYVVVSKSTQSNKHGRRVLISFATKALWKDYEEMRRQGDTVPNYINKITANYAAKNYGGEVIEYSIIQSEFEKYKTDFPKWR